MRLDVRLFQKIVIKLRGKKKKCYILYGFCNSAAGRRVCRILCVTFTSLVCKFTLKEFAGSSFSRLSVFYTGLML